MSRHVVVLIGPKGAGKSRLGALLDRVFGLRFLPVEPLWVEHAASPRDADWETRGYLKVAGAVADELTRHAAVVIEVTGAAPSTPVFLRALESAGALHRVRVEASLGHCLGRVQRRDPVGHVPVSLERVAEINQAAARAALDCEQRFDNTGDWFEPTVRSRARELLARLGLPRVARAPTLTTGRLTLRPWRDADAEPFAAMNADPRVMQHYPSVLTREQSDALLDRLRGHFDDVGFGMWAVETSAGPLMGFVGLNVPKFEAAFTPCVELGWRLAPEHWGHGYAREGARAALGFAFDELGLHQVLAWTVPANTRSERVMQALGMRRAPEDDFDHPNLPDGHSLRRHILYRLPRPEPSA
ncbi:MAG: GNAT family N-acetyltransferase [Polyangiaceae bacterium]|nr:GNAT family N-acetyltransferase [Polyangiaceae bacterium]